MQGEVTTDRTILEITGSDRMVFLQDLLTNDIKVADNTLVYAALLSPQGKYLFDFFLFHRGETTYLDVKSDMADALSSRLAMYRLRADVQIAKAEMTVTRGLDTGPEGGMPDPRNPALGWRRYDSDAPIGHVTENLINWDAIRVEHLIPEPGIELITGDSYILEMGFERLNGVDFRKGCYVGQEVTARMKHKTELRKGLARVTLDGPAKPGSDILRDGKTIGTLHTVAGPQALAYLRFDRAGDGMTADGAGVALG